MTNLVLIFDFDGTIADTHHYIIEISNRLASEFNYKTIEPHEVEHLKNKSSREVIEHLNIPLLKIPAIVAKAKKEFYRNISTVQPIAGLQEILQHLKDFNVKIGILSSNTSGNIKKFLQNHNLDIFDFIDTTSKIWSKNNSLKNIIQKNGFNKERIIYIGDEIRDITAAKKLGIKVAAVAWGYNSSYALKRYKPDFIIQTPQDLLNLCNLKN